MSAWQNYVARIDALSLRERLLLCAAVMGGLAFAVYTTAIEPPQRRQAALRVQMERQQAEIAALQARAPQTPRGDQPQAESGHRARVDEMKARIAEVDEAIEALHRQLVPAQRMRPLLQQVLRAESGAQLVSLRSLPVVPVTAKALPAGAAAPAGATPTKTDAAETGVYRHGVEVSLRGSYAALHGYLQRLEQAPAGMYWWRARLEADEQARLTLTLTLYTLSLDRAWLQV